MTTYCWMVECSTMKAAVEVSSNGLFRRMNFVPHYVLTSSVGRLNGSNAVVLILQFEAVPMRS
ncbi:MAG: hypothetical protein IJR86_02385 [Bacteroidaceae bacterium]|nr:hypothetical protein [Bacteroidaceae bacterium]